MSSAFAEGAEFLAGETAEIQPEHVGLDLPAQRIARSAAGDPGSALGFLLLALVLNGMIMFDIEPVFQKFVIGALLVLTATFDTLMNRREPIAFTRRPKREKFSTTKATAKSANISNAGWGKPKVKAVPNAFSAAPSLPGMIGWPLERISARPRAPVIMASVTTKAGSRMRR